MTDGLERGDVVSLKSGGALMTVKSLRTGKYPDFPYETITRVRCVWVDAVGHYHSDEFEGWLLKKITTGESA